MNKPLSVELGDTQNSTVILQIILWDNKIERLKFWMRHACCVVFATAVMFNSCNAFACMVTLGSRKVVSAQLLQASTTKIHKICQNMAMFITSMHVRSNRPFFPASSHL